MKQAKRVKAYRIELNGNDCRGLEAEFTAPELKRKREDYRAGSMSAPIAVDYGLEALKTTLVLEGDDIQIMETFGGCLGKGKTKIRCFAHVDSEDCDTSEDEYLLVCRPNSMKQEAFKGGEASKTTLELDVHVYARWRDNREIVYIDPQETIERYNGVDRLEVRRRALKMDH